MTLKSNYKIILQSHPTIKLSFGLCNIIIHVWVNLINTIPNLLKFIRINKQYISFWAG